MPKPISTAFLALSALIPGILVLNACNREPEPRRYRETVIRGAGANLQRGALAKLAWSLPAGWTVQPEGDPMRLTGFWAPDPDMTSQGEPDPKPVDVSLVQLEGDAGGLEANVTRWLGQIQVPASLAAQAIAAAEPVRTATGQQGLIVDFTGFLSGDMTQSKSIVGAIIDAGDHTLFVKAMGDKPRLAKIKPQLRAFCETLLIGEPAGTTAGSEPAHVNAKDAP
jgi:hypothetical protein